MNLRLTKTSVTALGLALAVSGAGVAVAAGSAGPAHRDTSLSWYEGDNATVADPNKTAVALKLLNADGTQVTTGTTTSPLPAFAVADATVRANDDSAALFVHVAQSDTAPGGWAGVQATGTDKYAGTGAVAGPAGVTGRPFARTSGGYTVADIAEALPSTSTSPTYAGVYELRLRTSSATAGVGSQYATTYLKVTGSTWAVTAAPVLGEQPPAPVVATSVAPAWPARLTYGTASAVRVAVNPASGTAKPTGTVRLLNGSTLLSQAALSGGAATLPIARTLAPGAKSLRVVYVTNAPAAFSGSESAPRAYNVAKAAPGKPGFTVTKKPSAKKAGAATITVPTAAGLVKATGKVQVTLKKGGTTKKVVGNVAAGSAKITLPKLPKGKYTVTVLYQGNVYYLTSTKAFSLTSKAK